MSRTLYSSRARDDFNRARLREMFSRVLALLRNEKNQLLSLT